MVIWEKKYQFVKRINVNQIIFQKNGIRFESWKKFLLGFIFRFSLTIPRIVVNPYSHKGFLFLGSENTCFGVKSIGIGCFSDCSSLKHIKLPETIENISRECFYSCSSLTTFEIPPHVTHIGDRCFSGCKSLKIIKIPLNVTSIGNKCFSNCKSLEIITIPSSVLMIGEYCFQYCFSLKIIVFETNYIPMCIEDILNISNLESLIISIPKELESFDQFIITVFDFKMKITNCKNLKIFPFYNKTKFENLFNISINENQFKFDERQRKIYVSTSLFEYVYLYKYNRIEEIKELSGMQCEMNKFNIDNNDMNRTMPIEQKIKKLYIF